MMTNKNEIDAGSIALYSASAFLILLGVAITVEKISEYNKKKKLNPANERIFLIGDSTGVGLSPKLAKIASQNNSTFDSNTIGGTNVNQWSHKSWIQKAIEFKPTITLISLGTNDANGIDTYGNSVEDTLDKDIQTLINKLAPSTVIWILPPNIKKFKSMPSIRYHIVRSGVKVINSQLADIDIGGDGIHPTGKGYQSWAEYIWKSIFE